MLRDAQMNRLFRRVEIRIIYPDNIFPPKVNRYKSGPHQGFGPNNIDELLMQTTDKLDELFPFWEFKMLELSPQGRTARYVFTFSGYSTKAATPVLQATSDNLINPPNPLGDFR